MKQMAAFGNATCRAEEWAVYFMQLDYHIMYRVRPLIISGFWDPASEFSYHWCWRQAPSSLMGTKILVWTLNFWLYSRLFAFGDFKKTFCQIIWVIWCKNGVTRISRVASFSPWVALLKGAKEEPRNKAVIVSRAPFRALWDHCVTGW